MLAEASPTVNDSLPWSPNIDTSVPNPVVTGQPLAGASKAKPFVIGFNQNEGMVFADLAYINSLVGGESTLLPETVNDLIIPSVWDDSVAKTIEGYSVTQDGQTTYPYLAPAPNPPSYMNGSALTLSNLINDFAFRCGSLAMVSNAQASTSGGSAPIYGYLFSQPPQVDAYNSGDKPPYTPLPGCLRANGNVCHGNELPYVFNTINAAYSANNNTSNSAPAGDQALAQTMAAAWASFVNNPNGPAAWSAVSTAYANLPTAWTAYTGSSPSLTQWNSGVTSSTQTVTAQSISSAANCPGLWNTIPPISSN